MPPPPTLPSFFTAPSPPEDMKAAWERIISLVGDCVEARKAHQDSQKSLVDFERMLRTPRFAMPQTPADAARLAYQGETLKRVDEEKRKALATSLAVLKDTNWWPVGLGRGDGERAAEKYEELIQLVLQVNVEAKAMHATYLKTALPASALPIKRRRISHPSALGPAPHTLPAIDDARLDSLHDQLSNLERRIADLQNHVQALSEQNRECIRREIDARLETLSFSVQSLSPAATDASPPELELARKKQHWMGMEKGVHDVGDTIAKLLVDLEVLKQQVEASEKQQAAEKAELNAARILKQRIHAYEAQRLQDEEEMLALTATFESLSQHSSLPAAPPLDFILRAIDDPIREVVQKEVRPIVDEMDRSLHEYIVKYDQELCRQLWTRIAQGGCGQQGELDA
ncbi:hypothetical protein C8R43DRAFT_1143193 [Mycena crocata]|nr:hypothetical protein C8R43DRAFT_1143193 [Mycena crocata]